MDKEELIIQEYDDEYALDEMMETRVEDMKIEYHENLVLLQNLLKEVTSQIATKQVNLIKIKEMINGN